MATVQLAARVSGRTRVTPKLSRYFFLGGTAAGSTTVTLDTVAKTHIVEIESEQAGKTIVEGSIGYLAQLEGLIVDGSTAVSGDIGYVAPLAATVAGSTTVAASFEGLLRAEGTRIGRTSVSASLRRISPFRTAGGGAGVALSSGTPTMVSLSVGIAGSSTFAAHGDHSHELDQSIAPTWTGIHRFNANISHIRNVAYTWPASQGAASSYLTNDGSGGLSWATLGGGSFDTTANYVMTGQWSWGNSTGGPNPRITVYQDGTVLGGVVSAAIVIDYWARPANSTNYVGIGFSVGTTYNAAGIYFNQRDAFSSDFPSGDLVFATRPASLLVEAQPIERLRITNNGFVTVPKTGQVALHALVDTNGATMDVGKLSQTNMRFYEGGWTNNGQQITFGFYGDPADTQTWASAAIGYINTSNATHGDMFVATRNVDTDTAPTIRFRVHDNGDFTFGNQRYTFPTTAGSSGYVLKTDGAGVLSWVAVSTLGVTSVNSLAGAVTIAGTSNQVNVNTAGSTITLSTPQNIDTTATPTFAGGNLLGTRPTLRLNHNSDSQSVRLADYVGSAAYLTYGISFDGTDWQRDDTGAASAIYSFSGSTPMAIYTVPAGANPATAALVNVANLNSAGLLHLPVTGSSAGLLIGGDAQLYRSAAGVLTIANAVTVGTAGTSSLNTAGLTVNQGAADNEILTLKSSDVAHGVTTLADTDAFAVFFKADATGGGVAFRGINSSATLASSYAFGLFGTVVTEDNTRSTSAIGGIIFSSAVKSGTSNTTHAADKNLAVFRNRNTTEVIIGADGAIWANGQLTLPTNGLTGGIIIGDTQLYRSAAAVLRTPQSLTVDGNFIVSTNTTHSGLTTLTGVATFTASPIIRTNAQTIVTVESYSSNQFLGSSFDMNRYRGSFASPTTVASADVAGYLNFNAYDGTALRQIAAIRTDVDTYTSTDDVSGRIVFYARPTGAAASVTEVMRLVGTGQARFPATGSSAGLLIGGDVQLYRSAADVLSTPDVFKVINGITESIYHASSAHSYITSDAAAASQGGFLIRKGGTIKFLMYVDGNSNDLQWFDGATNVARLNAGGAFSSISSIKSSSATAGIGYATGAGGTVTQATNKGTGVTLNAVCGTITLSNAALAAGTTVTFTLTNSAIAATDMVLINHTGTGTAGAYNIDAHSPGAGSVVISVRNITSGSLSEAIVLRFVVIKTVTS